MASFFKGLEIYQTKLLVSALALALLGCRRWPGRTSEKRPLTLFHVWLVVLPRLSHSSSFPLLNYLSVPSVF